MSLSEPIYLRFENITPPRHKFYEVDVELSRFYPKLLFHRWGPIGTQRPRSLRMVMTTPDEMQRQVEYLACRRRQRGYQTVAEIRTPVLGGSAA